MVGEYFLSPENAQQRQYEALRAYLVEGIGRDEAAARFGYTPATMASLMRDFRAGHVEFFSPRAPAPPCSPGSPRYRRPPR